jgi:hypothetical protein
MMAALIAVANPSAIDHNIWAFTQRLPIVRCGRINLFHTLVGAFNFKYPTFISPKFNQMELLMGHQLLVLLRM